MQPSVHTGDVAIPKLGFGTYDLMGARCAEAVGAALEVGYRHIDTAQMYGNEEAVGEGIRASGVPRADIFVTSKVWYDNLLPQDLVAAAEESLRRLQLDALDLYLIHWPNTDVPLSDSLGALASLKERGLTRAVGVSNFPSAMLRQAVAASPVPLAVNQVEYHPYLDQAAVLAACVEAGMGLTAYCPLARSTVLNEPAILQAAAAHGVAPSAAALAWLIGQEPVIAIPKTGDRGRMERNFAALTVSLTDSERRAIDALARPDGRMINPAFAPQWDAA